MKQRVNNLKGSKYFQYSRYMNDIMFRSRIAGSGSLSDVTGNLIGESDRDVLADW